MAASSLLSGDRLNVHFVNHEYDQGFIEQTELALSIASATAPTAITVLPPDFDAVELEFEYDGEALSVVLPSVLSYVAIVLAY